MTADCQVSQIGLELVLSAQGVLKRGKNVFVYVNDLLAILADEVMVVALLSMMVEKPVSAEFGLSYQI